MQKLFNYYIAVDWSARNLPSSAKPSHDAIWVGELDSNGFQKQTYWRTRHECTNYLKTLLYERINKNEKVIIGYDLDFGFPAGFVDAIGLINAKPKWKRMWDFLKSNIVDDELNSNNRFEVASKLNQLCMNEDLVNFGPLWGHPVKQNYEFLKPKGSIYPFKTKRNQTLRKFRWTESREPKAQPVWKLIGTASVGGQTLVGIPHIARLIDDEFISKYSKVWPFETGFKLPKIEEGDPFVLFVEIWPGLLSQKLNKEFKIKDQAQVAATVDWMGDLDKQGELGTLLQTPNNLSDEQEKECIEEEGWVLGSGAVLKTSGNQQELGL